MSKKLDVTKRSIYIYSDELEKEKLIYHLKSGKIILGPKAEENFKEELEKMEKAEKILIKRINLIKKFLEES